MFHDPSPDNFTRMTIPALRAIISSRDAKLAAQTMELEHADLVGIARCLMESQPANLARSPTQAAARVVETPLASNAVQKKKLQRNRGKDITDSKAARLQNRIQLFPDATPLQLRTVSDNDIAIIQNFRSGGSPTPLLELLTGERRIAAPIRRILVTSILKRDDLTPDAARAARSLQLSDMSSVDLREVITGIDKNVPEKQLLKMTQDRLISYIKALEAPDDMTHFDTARPLLDSDRPSGLFLLSEVALDNESKLNTMQSGVRNAKRPGQDLSVQSDSVRHRPNSDVSDL